MVKRERADRLLVARGLFDSRARAQAAAPLGWLQKPYTMASLVLEVRDALRKLSGTDR